MVDGLGASARLGPYRLVERLGVGAMGTVWRAQEGDRQVALKVIHPQLLEHKGCIQRFQREARAGRRVDHPNVVRTLEYDLLFVRGEPRPFLVMEYVEGQTIRELLRELGTVPEALVREIGVQVARGLSAIHAAGLVHRDLKPENVLITNDHRVRIMDLGIARHAFPAKELTGDDQFAGSVLYAAPEQFLSGGDVGSPADLYALGVVLYELASGVNPYRRDDLAQVVDAHLEFSPERLDRRTGETSLFLSEVVATLLAKAPAGRFSSAHALGEVLATGETSGWWGERERRVLEARARRVRVPVRRETSLRGRRADLARLREAWVHARSRRGATLLLEGEAGIGKSRLVDAFLSELDNRDAHLLYGAFAPAGGRGGIAGALLEHLGEVGLESALRPHLESTPSLVPALAAVLRRAPLPEGAPTLQGEVFHTVCVHLVRSLAGEKPIVWVVEDLHFADREDRRLLLSLARSLARDPVLFILTTRPRPESEELESLRSVESLARWELSRLEASEVVAIVQEALGGGRCAEELGPLIARKSDGVPFFVLALTRELRERGLPGRVDRAVAQVPRTVEEIPIASSVQESVELRLRGLTGEERRVLDVAAVQGAEFDAGLVAGVLRREFVPVLQDLARMERGRGVVLSAERKFRFDHHLLREVVYEALPPRLRVEYHALLAEAFAARVERTGAPRASLRGEDAVFLARHFLLGDRAGDVARVLLPALDHLLGTFRNETVLDLAGRALAVAGVSAGEERIEVLRRQRKAYERLGRTDEQIQVAEEALAIAVSLDRPAVEARARLDLGASLWWGRQLDEAAAEFDRALALGREAGDLEAVGKATGQLGIVAHRRGHHEEAERLYVESIRIARQAGDLQGEATMLGNLGAVSIELGKVSTARQVLEQALHRARDLGDRVGEGMALGNLSGLEYRLGRIEEAKALIEQDLAISAETGQRSAQAAATGNLGVVLFELGRFEEAAANHRRHLEISLELGDRVGVAAATGNLANIAYRLGRLAEARDLYERQRALACEIGDRREEAIAEGNLGSLWLLLGRSREARDCLERSLAIGRETGLLPMLTGTLSGLAVAAEHRGAGDEAEALHREVLESHRSAGNAAGEASALVALGRLRLEQGRVREAESMLQESLGIAERSGNVGVQVLAGALLAGLTGADPDPAVVLFSRAEASLDHALCIEIRFRLFQATGERGHLEEAHRLLCHLRDHAPGEHRESMIRNVPLHRDVMAAWEEHGGAD